MIFLLLTLTHNATGGEIGTLGFWNHYIQRLPSQVPLPIFWDSEARTSIIGTSLDAAVNSKLSHLSREFSHLRQDTLEIEWCKQCWWHEESGILTLDDWMLVDALYRSRALEMPDIGHVMVPLVDMANHESGNDATALFETDLDKNAVLLLRPGKALKNTEEITISYGDDKGACEMLFSYGFLEDKMTSSNEIFLELEIPDDDPLKLAKQRVANCAPGFKLQESLGKIIWEGSYVWLLCINEEDGLEFNILQTNDGGKELQVLWKEQPLQDFNGFDRLIEEDPRQDLFRLRAISVLQARVGHQIQLLDQMSQAGSHIERGVLRMASRLRGLERPLMVRAYAVFEEQVRARGAWSNSIQHLIADDPWWTENSIV